MKIRFELTIEDVIAYRQAEFLKSLQWRFVATLGFVFLLGAFYSMTVLIVEHFAAPVASFFIFACLLMMVGCFVAAPNLASGFVGWRTRNVVDALTDRGIIGGYAMEIQDGFLTVATENLTYHFDVREIQGIDVWRTVTVVFMTTGQTFIIPMDRFPEKSIYWFVQELREAWENRHSGPPTVLRSLRLPREERIQELR